MTFSAAKVFLLLAACCFLLAVFGVPVSVALVPLGLLFWVVASLV